MGRMSPEYPRSPFTWPEARAAGISRRLLDEAVECRALRRVLHGVYVEADLEDTPLLRAQAAKLVISPHSVLCDRTAAWVLGCDVHDYRELDVVPPIESYVLRGHDPTDRPECAGGTRDLRPVDWCVVEGVRVTTPIRTAMDLGCKLGRRSALAAMDALMRAYGFTVDDMMRILPRYFRRRGVRRLRTLVALVDGRSESAGSPGRGSRSSTVAFRSRPCSTGSALTTFRRTASTWPTRTPVSRSSTTARSSTPGPRTGSTTGVGASCSATTAGRSSC
jgi:hypothetical protein